MSTRKRTVAYHGGQVARNTDLDEAWAITRGDDQSVFIIEVHGATVMDTVIIEAAVLRSDRFLLHLGLTRVAWAWPGRDFAVHLTEEEVSIVRDEGFPTLEKAIERVKVSLAQQRIVMLDRIKGLDREIERMEKIKVERAELQALLDADVDWKAGRL